MTEKTAFRILAALYPDRKPSEVRKIIEDALSKEANPDDVELWMILAKEQDEKPVKTVIEEHHYHHYDRYLPYTTWSSTSDAVVPNPGITISCNGIDNSNLCDESYYNGVTL